MLIQLPISVLVNLVEHRGRLLRGNRLVEKKYVLYICWLIVYLYFNLQEIFVLVFVHRGNHLVF